MIRIALSVGLVAGALAISLFSAPAQAQSTRTWVSGVGDDVNPCSRTAPCKTFAGAISKTATNGIINCLDPAGFGAVTITKSLTIDCHEELGAILAGFTTGVIINIAAGNANDPLRTVRLRGLQIDGAGVSGSVGTRTGIRGINVLRAAGVIIENVVIQNFVNEGILVQTDTDLELHLRESVINDNNGNGVAVSPLGTATVRGDLVDMRITRNGGAGLLVTRPAGATASLAVDDSEIERNTNFGIRATGVGAIVRLSDSTITLNGTGLSAINNATITSLGNNVIIGNLTDDGAPTSTVGLD